MRVHLRTIVDVDKPIELSDLNVKEKLVAGFKIKYRKSKMYREKVEKKKAKEDLERMHKIDKVKEALLYRMHSHFSEAKNTSTLQITVERYYKDVILEVITSKEFLGFNIKMKRENSDMLLAFPNIPIMLIIEKKVLVDEE